MEIPLWLTFLVFSPAAVLVMTTPIHAHNECDMQILDKVDLRRIMGRIVVPFNMMRTNRNIQLDDQFNIAFHGFERVRTEIFKVVKATRNLGGSLPAYEDLALPLLSGSVIKLNGTVKEVARMLDECQSQAVSVSALDQVVGQVVGHLDQAVGGKLSWAFIEALRRSQEEELRKEHIFDSSLYDEDYDHVGTTKEYIPWHPERLYRDLLECDQECQAQAIGPDFTGKHVAIEDVAAVFSRMVTAVMTDHRQRYLRYMADTYKIRTGLEEAIARLVDVEGGLVAFEKVSSGLGERVVSHLESFKHSGQQLLKHLARMTCQ